MATGFFKFIPLTHGGVRLDILANKLRFIMRQRPTVTVSDPGRYAEYDMTKDQVNALVAMLQDAKAAVPFPGAASGATEGFFGYIDLAGDGGFRVDLLSNTIGLSIVIHPKQNTLYVFSATMELGLAQADDLIAQLIAARNLVWP